MSCGGFGAKEKGSDHFAAHIRLLKNSAQRVNLRQNSILAEEKRRTGWGIGAAAFSPKPHFACPRGFSTA